MTCISMNFTADSTIENRADMSAFEGEKINMPRSGQSGLLTYTTLMVFVSIYKQRVFRRHAGVSGHIRSIKTLIGVIWETCPLCPLHSTIGGRAPSEASA